MLGCHLAGDKDLLAGQTAGADALPDTGFIFIRLRGVNMAVTQRNGNPNRFRRLPVRNEPCAKSQLGDLHAIGQRIGFL